MARGSTKSKSKPRVATPVGAAAEYARAQAAARAKISPIEDAKRVVHGILNPVFGNSAEDLNNYMPNIVNLPGSLIGLAGALYNRRADGKAFDGSNVIEREGNRALAAGARADTRGRARIGIGLPQNTRDNALEIIPGLLIPARGASGIARAVAPKATRVVSRVVQATPKPVRMAGTVAKELAIPFNQAKTPLGKAAVVGTGAGITAGVDVLSENLDPTYESALTTSDIGPTDGSDDAFAAFIEQDDPEVEQQLLSVQSDPDADFAAAIEGAPTINEADEIEEEEKWSTWDKSIAAIGAVGLGVAAIVAGRSALVRAAENAATETPTFTGKKFRRSRGGIGERIDTAWVQQDAPVRNAADEFLSPQHAAEYKHNSDLINNVSIGARVANFVRTGKLPKTTTRTQPLAPVVESYAKELDLNEQRIVSDALLAQSSLDDFNRTGVLSSLNTSRDGQPVTAAQLRATVASARANPKYVKYMDAITKSYQDLLKYKVQRGLLTVDEARDLAIQRPNYVRMSRDLKTEAKPVEGSPFDPNKDNGPGFARNTEENTGVQGDTGIGNPVNALLDDWASTIREAELNDLRAFALEKFAAANPDLVRRIPHGVKPNTEEGLHQVRINGITSNYHVRDARISEAMKYSPRATIAELEMIRQVSQNVVTGPIGSLANGFAFFKSPIYDTTMGMLLKPKGVNLGVINEAISHVAPRWGNDNLTGILARLDPTALVSAPIGAVRYSWDNMRGAMAQNLSEQLIKEHSWLRSAIGDNNVAALRDTLQAAYENSIKSLMEETGVSSLTMHGTPDPSTVLSGLEGITPKFHSAMAEQLARDTLEARKAGEVGPLAPILASGNSMLGRAKANTISRLYGSLLEAAHNGFRYQMVASNVKRQPDLAKLASQARRISVDSAQHGGNNAVNKAAGAFMYANLTIQSLAAAGKMIAQSPMQFAMNWGSVALPLVAMHYLSLASDPVALEQHKNKSAQQKARAVTTFGGAEIPLDPIMRLTLLPFMATLDHMTGAHDGKWNRGVLDSMLAWLEGEEPNDDYKQDMSDMFWDDVKSNIPFAPDAQPLINAAFSYVGIDPGMSRAMGEVAPIRNQGISGFDPDQKKTDSLMNSYAETALTTLGGSFLQNFIGMADDAYRAYVHPKGGPVEAFGAASSRYRDTLAKGAGVMRPLLFGGYEQVSAVTDTDWKIVKTKDEGIEQAIKVYDKNVVAPNITSLDNSIAERMDADNNIQSAAGTANAMIGAAAKHLSGTLRPITLQQNKLAKQAEAVRNGYLTRQEEKTGKLNEITEQRRYYTLLRRQIIERYEHSIRQQIGDEDFTFEDYDPDKYNVPVNVPVQ